MITPEELLIYLPPVKGRTDLIIEEQTTTDIINEMLKASLYFQKDYNNIPVDAFSSLKEIWTFTKKTFHYKEDSELAQDLQSPSVMIENAIDGNGSVDCKSYSLFISGLLTSKGNKDWFFKFASYNSEKEPTHVYVVCNGYILDCCMNSFNSEANCSYYICASPYKKSDMAINRISGTNNVQKRLNHNPTIYGRQRRYGTVGEGNGKGASPKANKQAKEKQPSQKDKDAGLTVPIPAPAITITQQPTNTGGTGAFVVKPDITMSASILLPIKFNYALAGASKKNTKKPKKVSSLESFISSTANLVTGENFSNIPEGQYEAFYSIEMKGHTAKSNSTRFVISAPESKIVKTVDTKVKKKIPVITTNSSIFTPTNIAIGAGVIIGGYLLMKKK